MERDERGRDPKGMSLEELEMERDEVEGDLVAIRLQLDHAKQNAVQHGEYSDGDWYAKAQAAKSFKGRRHQLLLRVIADRKKQLRTAVARTREQAFIDSARRLLRHEDYEAIWADVRASGN